MFLKNYYAVLGVPHAATAEEIRNAFRKLAKTYHPDVAPDNPFAEAHFKEIQEAYETLSDPERRTRYDEDLWLRGLTNRSRNAVAITPDWLVSEAEKLRRHMSMIDSYRMNHLALKEYVESLLSDEHLSVLRDAPDRREHILEALFISVAKLRLPLLRALEPRLQLLADGHNDTRTRIQTFIHLRQREADWDRRRPWIVLGIAILICLLIWLAR
jgi:curved DNA-binding protein CbpA